MKRFVLLISTWCWLATLFGCSSTPVVQTGADAERNEQGLNKVDHTTFDKAYIDPSEPLSNYTKFIFTPLDFAEMEVISPKITNTRRSTWEFTDKDESFFDYAYIQGISKHFSDHTAFSITDTPGPNVALVKSRITRFAPTTPKYDSIDRGARSEFLARNSGYITILTDIYDAQTGKLLANLEMNRDIGNHIQPVRITYTQFNSDVRNTFSRWAYLLTEQLEQTRQ